MNEKRAIVISGGPSVGKTTIVNAVEKLGFPVLHEISTALIKEGILSPKSEREKFQAEILRRQLEGEAKLLKLNTLFFVDRGLLDGMAYYVLDGLKIPDQFETLDISHYAMMFLLEELPMFEDNGVRFEDLEYSKRITPVIERHYRARNIPILRVPAISVDERVHLILSETQKLCRQA